MFKEFCLIIRFLYTLIYRNIKKIFKKYCFYCLCLIFMSFSLMALFSYMATPQIRPILDSFISGGNTLHFYGLLKIMGINVSLFTLVFYVLLKIISKEQTILEIMLRNFGVSNLARNISINLCKYSMIIILTNIFIGFIYYPAIFTSSLNLISKLLLVLYILLQSIFYILFLDIGYNLLIRLFYWLKIKIYRRVATIIFIFLNSYIFIKIFKNPSIIFTSEKAYNPIYFMSSIFVFSFENISKLVDFNLIIFISVIVMVCVIYVVSNCYYIDSTQCNSDYLISITSWKFFRGRKAIITKELKEQIRNSENASNFIYILLITIGVKLISNQLFKNALVSNVLILFPLVTFMTSFGNEQPIKHVYRLCNISPFKIFIYKYLGSLAISLLQCFILISIIDFKLIFSNGFALVMGCFLLANLFNLLGILFPINIKNSLGTVAIISVIIISLIPIVLNIIYFMSYFNLSDKNINILLSLAILALFAISIYIFIRKINSTKVYEGD